MRDTTADASGIPPASRPPRRPWRVVLADDHEVVRDGLRGLVSAHPDLRVAGEAADAEAVCRLVGALAERGEPPDVVVMDVSMPAGGAGGAGGLVATARIRRDHPGVKVLAFSAHEDRAYLRSLLEAGASGYVLKRSAADELVRALRAVAAGGTHLDPALSAAVAGAVMRGTAVTAAAGSSAAAAAAEGKAGPPQWPLTERESSVLRLLAGGHTTKEAAAQLGVSIKSVETYKVRGMKKLGLGDRVELVRYALAQGWLQGAR